MTPGQITQLRQLLKQTIKIMPDRGIDPDIFCLVGQALALLPCETCNGKKMIKEHTDTPNPYSYRWKPCPDCQKKPIESKEAEIKKILSDAFMEYRQAYRSDETDETFLPPRDKYPDIVSYMAAKVIEILN